MRDRVHILHVEDSEDDASLFGASFEQESSGQGQLHQVRTAEDALDFILKRGRHAEAPDVGLILLDLGLPGMSGQDLLGELKRTPALRNIPVVVLTGSSDVGDLMSSYGRHANAVIRKPHDLSELVELVNAIDVFWTRLVSLPLAPGLMRPRAQRES